MRESLPARRLAHIIETTFGEVGYTISYGTFMDAPARVSEVFIDCTKSASQAAVVGRDAAILVSLALQHGVTLDTLCHGITRDGLGKPLSIAGHALDLVKAEIAGGA